MMRPPALERGDSVAVCAPSGAMPPFMRGRLLRGCRWLTDQGLRVRDESFAGRGHDAAQTRADALNRCFADTRTRAVFTAIGGYGTLSVLPLLDYDAFARDPKIVVGYSDMTALILGLQARTGIVTFHGPTVIPELAEHPEPHPYTVASLRSCLTRSTESIDLRPPDDIVDGFIDWRVDDRPLRGRAPHPPWTTVAPGAVEGTSFGGNLETLAAMVGTGYLAPPARTILFLETLETDRRLIEQRLMQLRLSAMLDCVVGVVLGHGMRTTDDEEAGFRRCVADAFDDVPILAGVDIGHRDPMATIPIGVEARLDASGRRIRFAPGVRARSSRTSDD